MMMSTTQLNNGVSTTLIDLNMDCLLKIVRFLCLSDLAKVSEVCQLFQYLAVETFKYEWKNTTVRLSNDSNISKLESTAILRNFGSQLQNVSIVFDIQGNDKFLNMIIDKCSPQLTQVDFSSTCFDVELKTVLSKENISRLNAKFVNLKRLRFKDNIEDITESECIEQHFPALEELSLIGYPFGNGNVQRFVEFNPQVKSLSFFHSNRVQAARSLIQIIDQRLPQLEKLGLWIDGHAAANDYRPRFLKNLKRLKVHDYEEATNIQHLSISSKRVEEMELELRFCSETLIDLICQYKELDKLSIRIFRDSPFDCKFLQKLNKHLPKLAEVSISGSWKNLDHNAIVRFVHGSKQLVKFIITDAQNKDILEDMNKIQKNLDSAQWTVAYKSSPRQLNFIRVKRPVETNQIT